MDTAVVDRLSDSIPIELDRKRFFCLDFNAICALRKEVGINLMNPAEASKLEAALNENDPEIIRGLLYAGLKSDDPEITIDQVGALLTFENLEKFVRVLDDAFATASLTDEQKKSSQSAPVARKKVKAKRKK